MAYYVIWGTVQTVSINQIGAQKGVTSSVSETHFLYVMLSVDFLSAESISIKHG